MEILALFASLDRIPHFWPMPGFDEPADLVDRLLGAGSRGSRRGMLMALDPARFDPIGTAGTAISRPGPT